MAGRHSNSGITSFLSDIVDDIKDFVDDEVLDRGRDTERDVRRAAQNWADSDHDSRGGRSRRGERGGSARGYDSDLDQLRRAVRSLAEKVDGLGGGSRADLPISGYDDLTVVEVSNQIGKLTQADLRRVEAYERAHANRSTLLDRIEVLRGSEPWAGYDEQTVVEVRDVLQRVDAAKAREVHAYESSHKDRQGVLDAVAATLPS